MKQTIVIADKPYEMKSNLRVHENYKNLYGEELVKVIKETNDKIQSVTSDDIGEIGSIALTCIKIAHLMCKENDPNFKSLSEWEEELDDDLVTTWFGEVLALAFAPFRRRLPQDHKQ